MKTPLAITFLLLLTLAASLATRSQAVTKEVDFFGESVTLPANFVSPSFSGPLSETAVQRFVNSLPPDSLQPFLTALLNYKKAHNPEDWLYYQLVRKVAGHISPKADNYYRYTLYKWWFLVQSGYDARLALSGDYLLFYIQCDEKVYNIPSRTINGRQYVCLNYHDYRSAIDFSVRRFELATLPVSQTAQPFSYKVQRLPDFAQAHCTEKDVRFSFGADEYSYRIKENPQVKTLFTNYPVVDYDLQFNMPLSRPVYESLIPLLKKQLKGLNQKDGITFLMRFTRYAFLFKSDTEAFGGEKRLSPEQTLLSEFSDCEDRAALFFLLVKEIYNLPMLVLAYPDHVTVAVQFEKPYGQTISYNGKEYSVCEPSPQRYDLNVGQLLPELKRQRYEIAYAYHPSK